MAARAATIRVPPLERKLVYELPPAPAFSSGGKIPGSISPTGGVQLARASTLAATAIEMSPTAMTATDVGHVVVDPKRAQLTRASTLASPQTALEVMSSPSVPRQI